MENNTAKTQVRDVVDMYVIGYCDVSAKNYPDTANVWVSDNLDGSNGQYWRRGLLSF
jgi:hypothetical protein